MLKKLLDWIAAYLSERRTDRELRRLDAHTLRDIGLDRGRL
jgi:uncharacterized protein YjiS (DUF1127 family)